MNDLLEVKPIARGPRLFLVLVPLVLILGVGLYDALKGVTAAAFVKSNPTVDRLIRGRFQRTVDKRFENQSKAMRIVGPYWNEAMLGLFLETPSKIAAGYDDFLFYTSSLRPNPNWKVVRPVDHVARVREWIGEDVRTIVLVMPSKWRVYPEKLRDPSISEKQHGAYERARGRMLSLGYEAPDVLSLLLEEKERQPERLLYPPSDTHLSQWGFYRVALRLSPELFGVAPSTSSERLAAVEVDPDHVLFGELLKVLQIRRESAVGRRRLFAEPAFLAPATGDAPAEVLLIGDSFVEVQKQLFPRLLQVTSGVTLDRSSSTPLGVERFDLAEKTLAAYRGSPPRVFIAVYSERRF